jgi:hypothetical protein
MLLLLLLLLLQGSPPAGFGTAEVSGRKVARSTWQRYQRLQQEMQPAAAAAAVVVSGTQPRRLF